MQGRPKIDPTSVESYELKHRDWSWVRNEALQGKWAKDVHFVKAVRALKGAAETWGDSNEFFLKAAVKYSATFNNWTGFNDESRSFPRR